MRSRLFSCCFKTRTLSRENSLDKSLQGRAKEVQGENIAKKVSSSSQNETNERESDHGNTTSQIEYEENLLEEEKRTKIGWKKRLTIWKAKQKRERKEKGKKGRKGKNTKCSRPGVLDITIEVDSPVHLVATSGTTSPSEDKLHSGTNQDSLDTNSHSQVCNASSKNATLSSAHNEKACFHPAPDHSLTAASATIENLPTLRSCKEIYPYQEKQDDIVLELPGSTTDLQDEKQESTSHFTRETPVASPQFMMVENGANEETTTITVHTISECNPSNNGNIPEETSYYGYDIEQKLASEADECPEDVLERNNSVSEENEELQVVIEEEKRFVSDSADTNMGSEGERGSFPENLCESDGIYTPENSECSGYDNEEKVSSETKECSEDVVEEEGSLNNEGTEGCRYDYTETNTGTEGEGVSYTKSRSDTGGIAPVESKHHEETKLPSDKADKFSDEVLSYMSMTAEGCRYDYTETNKGTEGGVSYTKSRSDTGGIAPVESNHHEETKLPSDEADKFSDEVLSYISVTDKEIQVSIEGTESLVSDSTDTNMGSEGERRSLTENLCENDGITQDNSQYSDYYDEEKRSSSETKECSEEVVEDRCLLSDKGSESSNVGDYAGTNLGSAMERVSFTAVNESLEEVVEEDDVVK